MTTPIKDPLEIAVDTYINGAQPLVPIEKARNPVERGLATLTAVRDAYRAGFHEGWMKCNEKGDASQRD